MKFDKLFAAIAEVRETHQKDVAEVMRKQMKLEELLLDVQKNVQFILQRLDESSSKVEPWSTAAKSPLCSPFREFSPEQQLDEKSPKAKTPKRSIFINLSPEKTPKNGKYKKKPTPLTKSRLLVKGGLTTEKERNIIQSIADLDDE